jgi:hypothetical protein
VYVEKFASKEGLGVSTNLRSSYMVSSEYEQELPGVERQKGSGKQRL